MRYFDEKRKTDNSSVYRKAAILAELNCSYCSPNRGCNGNRNKTLRSWKDRTKKRKQWQ